MIKSTSAFRGWINFQAVYVLSKFCVLGNCILLLLELPFWNPPAASICKNLQSGLYSSSPASPCIVQLCLVKCEECGDNDCLEWRAQKPAQRPEFHPPSRSHAGLLAIWGGGGGGGAQGFPSPELVLTGRCQGEIPTDALSVRARGVQANPTETCEQPISVALAALRDNIGDYKSSALLVLSSLKFKLKAQVG